jgi:hypothetical protein
MADSSGRSEIKEGPLDKPGRAGGAKNSPLATTPAAAEGPGVVAGTLGEKRLKAEVSSITWAVCRSSLSSSLWMSK